MIEVNWVAWHHGMPVIGFCTENPTVPAYQKCIMCPSTVLYDPAQYHMATVLKSTSQLAIFWVSGSWILSWLLLAVTSSDIIKLEQN